MEMESILYNIYIDPIFSESERNAKLFSEIYPLFLNKATGSFFTPPNIAKTVVEQCFRDSQLKSNVKILDPACGIGEFLISAANKILNRISQEKSFTMQDDSDIRFEIIRNCLFGYDIDENIVHLCKFRLLLWALTPKLQNHSLKFTEVQEMYLNFECNIIHQDFFEVISLQKKFHYILCNPPYNAEMLETQEIKLKDKFPGIIRNSAAYFFLLCESLLESKGKMGFILPKSVSYSKRWRTLKNQILKQLEFIQDISKAFNNVRLEEIILITSKDSDSHRYITKDNSHKPTQIVKTNILYEESLILSISPMEYELYKKFSSLQHKLEEYIVAYRGKNVQKLANEEKKVPSNPFYCLGGKEIKSFYCLPPTKFIPRENLQIPHEKLKSGVILGQLANAHVKKPRPYYKLAFTKAPTSRKWITFDTIINISPNNYGKSQHEFFTEFLLCYLNSDVFSWYLYKIVYAGAIRSTRLDAEYLYKVPFLPIQPEQHILFVIFHFLANSLTFLSEKFYLNGNAYLDIPNMLKRLRLFMNSLIIMQYFFKSRLSRWLNSLEIDNIVKKESKKTENISNMLSILWNSTYSEIMKQIRTTKEWKIMIIE